jgi:hypothetical protein
VLVLVIVLVIEKTADIGSSTSTSTITREIIIPIDAAALFTRNASGARY